MSAELALEVFAYRIQSTSVHTRPHWAGWTASCSLPGIGENDVVMRERILSGMQWLESIFDSEANNGRGEREITKPAAVCGSCHPDR